MSAIRRMADIAQTLDHQGLYSQADAITDVMWRLQNRLVRTAQTTIDPFNGGGLTFDKVTQNVPGANFLTNNLPSGAFGSQVGLYQNLPGWTYQQDGGPEDPISAPYAWGYNLQGMTAEQIKNVKDAEFARNAQQSISRIIPLLRQWGEFYKKTTPTPEKKNELVEDILTRIKGAGPKAAAQAIAQGWPDMPQDIKQMLEQKLQGYQMVNAIP